MEDICGRSACAGGGLGLLLLAALGWTFYNSWRSERKERATKAVQVKEDAERTARENRERDLFIIALLKSDEQFWKSFNEAPREDQLKRFEEACQDYDELNYIHDWIRRISALDEVRRREHEPQVRLMTARYKRLMEAMHRPISL